MDPDPHWDKWSFWVAVAGLVWSVAATLIHGA